jgi:putative ATPase
MSELKFEATVGRVRVQVRQGDLTREAVDAVVNAANERLLHGGGLAGALVRAGGDVIQWESDTLAPVPTGGAVSTTGGALPCRRVVHAVGPIWGRRPDGESDRLLVSAVRAALRVAEADGAESIAIPAISSGVFGFPKDRCARLICEAVEAFARSEERRTVADVRLCNFDEETVAVFEDAARTRWGGG